MAYLGNDLQVAYQSYQIIDDISSSFNGVLTTFPLQVGGVTPVPFPINPQQCLISVNGVIQEPDPSGTSGFNLVGSNIEFSSAPTGGHAFFGVILAGADYVNVGVNYPSGSESAPSITFDTDLDTGIYNPAANELGFSTNSVQRLKIESDGDINIDSGGVFYDATNNRLGIGTTSPGYLIDCSNSSAPTLRLTDSIRHLLVRGGSTTQNPSIGTDYPGDLSFFTNGAANERARIDSSGRLLVGTSSARSNFFNNTIFSPSFQAEGATNDGAMASFVSSSSTLPFYLNLCRQRSGSVGGNTAMNAADQAIAYITFQGSDGTNFVEAAQIRCETDGTPGADDMPGRLVFTTTADGASSPTERMRITNGGSVLVGGAIPQGVGPALGYMMAIRAPSGLQSLLSIAAPGQTADTQGMVVGIDNNSGYVVVRDNKNLVFATNDITRMTIGNSGGVVIVGSLSKGSGSFRIDHPLPEKKNTHQLVHSFIEGPQADLIYRGHVCLINGKAQVNIDKAARMTEGTFEALCRDVCCFTTNETDWTPVRGSVSGNILTIEAQDPASCADVCWLVIGERKDQHMLDTDWTDENGKVITEPLKETLIPEAD